MMEFGKTLKLAREARGLTVDDVAEMTRIMPRTIENLEREIFSDIVAPIYGRGFVKLYCEAVGIDHRPLVDEFMEIYNGNREAQIAERPVSGAAVPLEPEISATKEEEPAPGVPESVTASEPPLRGDLFSAETAFSPEPEAHADGVIRSAAQDEEDEQATAGIPPPKPSAGANFSRYASPIDSREEPGRFRFRMPAIPPALWRIGVLAAAAAALLWALAAGIRALYRTTMPGAAETAPASAEKSPAVAKGSGNAGDAAKPSEPRKPVEIPQLYID